MIAQWHKFQQVHFSTNGYEDSNIIYDKRCCKILSLCLLSFNSVILSHSGGNSRMEKGHPKERYKTTASVKARLPCGQLFRSFNIRPLAIAYIYIYIYIYIYGDEFFCCGQPEKFQTDSETHCKIQKLYMAFMYLFLTSLITSVYYTKINSSNVHSYNVRTFVLDIGF
jgi:hypothetical protein